MNALAKSLWVALLLSLLGGCTSKTGPAEEAQDSDGALRADSSVVDTETADVGPTRTSVEASSRPALSDGGEVASPSAPEQGSLPVPATAQPVAGDGGAPAPAASVEAAVPEDLVGDSAWCTQCQNFGGETGDFTDATPAPPEACTQRIVDIDLEADAGADVRAAMAQLEIDTVVEAAWLSLDDDRSPRGFDASTTLHLTTEVLRAERVELSALDPQLASACTTRVRFAVRVTVATADGAMLGSVDGWASSYGGGVRLTGLGAANHFTGSLRVDVYPDDGETLAVYMSAYITDDQLRGSIQVQVRQVEESYDTPFDRVVELRFPLDDCEVEQVPLTDSELAELAQLVEQELTAFDPLPAQHWLVGAAAEPDPMGDTVLAFELGELHAGCRQVIPGSRDSMTFTASPQLNTLDARFDYSESIEGSLELSRAPDGAPMQLLSMHMYHDSEVVDASNLAALTGMDDISLPGADCGFSYFAHDYVRREDDSTELMGYFGIGSTACQVGSGVRERATAAFTSWCTGSCQSPPEPRYLD